jgi:serine/threonine protein phosphatase PrpC
VYEDETSNPVKFGLDSSLRQRLVKPHTPYQKDIPTTQSINLESLNDGGNDAMDPVDPQKEIEDTPKIPSQENRGDTNSFTSVDDESTNNGGCGESSDASDDTSSEAEDSDEDKDLSDVRHSEAHGGIIAAAVSMQGMRPHNEDRFILNTSFFSPASLFAVFDGHDGPAASTYCAKNMVKVVKSSKHSLKDIGGALKEAFLKIDSKFLDTAKDGGTTALVAFLTGNRQLYVANAGDSRCIACVAGEAVALSVDHKPDLPAEKKRIEEASHDVQDSVEIVQGKRTKIARVDGKLAVSRAIGDSDFKDNPSAPATEQAVTSEPDIREV